MFAYSSHVSGQKRRSKSRSREWDKKVTFEVRDENNKEIAYAVDIVYGKQSSGFSRIIEIPMPIKEYVLPAGIKGQTFDLCVKEN